MSEEDQTEVQAANEAVLRHLRLAGGRNLGMENGRQEAGHFKDPDCSEDERPLHPVDQIRQGLESLSGRVANGDYYAASRVLDAALKAIRILSSSPIAADMAFSEMEWPQIVPGGPTEGPLFKGWLKDWRSIEVGRGILLPSKGSGRFDHGKPAGLALRCFLSILRDRRALNPESSPWENEAQELPPLSLETVGQWRDLSMKILESGEPDWRVWLAAELPELRHSAIQRTQRLLHGEEWVNDGGKNHEPSQEGARITVKEALRKGFVTLFESF